MSKLLIDKAPRLFCELCDSEILIKKTAKKRTSESDHFLHYQL